MIWGPDLRGGVTDSLDTHPDTCHICPVAQGDAPTPSYINAFMTPVMHQMVKNLHAPRFDDSAENWPSFFWDFQEYLSKLSPIQKIDDSCKLRLFEDAMPATLKGELRLMRKAKRGNLTYHEVIAKFEARYGTGGTPKLRKKWSEVSMATAGKITTKQLREFQVNFLACAEEVKDATPQEVRRMAMQKLPPFMKNWVIEAEQKKEREHPLVQITLVEGLNEAELGENVRILTGERPTKVRILGGGVYHVEFSNLSAAKKMMSFHMREFEGCPRPLLVSILEQPLPTLELFEVLNEKLAGKERAEMYNTTERQIRETKVQNSPKEKKEGKATAAAVPHAPAPSNTPYIAGFDRPSANYVQSGGNGNANPPEVIYPFKSWRDRLPNAGRGGNQSAVSATAGTGARGGEGPDHKILNLAPPLEPKMFPGQRRLPPGERRTDVFLHREAEVLGRGTPGSREM